MRLRLTKLCEVIISQKFTPEQITVSSVEFSQRSLMESLAKGNEGYFVKASRFQESAKQLLKSLENAETKCKRNYDLCAKLILEKEQLTKEFQEYKSNGYVSKEEFNKLLETNENNSLTEKMRNLTEYKKAAQSAFLENENLRNRILDIKGRLNIIQDDIF